MLQAAKVVHEEKLPESGEVYLQYALLYSTVQVGRLGCRV